ncbi:MAG: yjeE [Chlamydiales bacterium]|nr:yjeE [Chlamydiales bacterium]
MKSLQQITHSAAETQAIAYVIGKRLKPNTVICFFGDLAAGKTTFIQGLVSSLVDASDEIVVNSPTFSYLNIYPGKLPVYHFDLYRLKDAEQFLEAGFDEYFYADGICCIEWSERIQTILPSSILKVSIEHRGPEQRHITISPWEETLLL